MQALHGLHWSAASISVRPPSCTLPIGCRLVVAPPRLALVLGLGLRVGLEQLWRPRRRWCGCMCLLYLAAWLDPCALLF